MDLNDETMRKWIKEAKVGEGTYAVVYRGRHSVTGRRVAIKKIKIGQFKDGLDMSAVREVKYLRELVHPNVIALLDVFSAKTNLNLVLEFLESDLEVVIRDQNHVFLPADVKSWMAMMLRGLEFCHRNWILHRDLKPNNLLIAADGQLKIADFGLARDFADPTPDFRMTSQVITRWYRPPELLFGCRHYGTAVDMWSIGTIFAELMLRVPYLAGESDLDQLKTIFRALGTPTEEMWPGHTKLPNYCVVGNFPKSPLNALFTAASEEALDLLSKCLIYEPRKRITAKEALYHPYFYALPHATHPSKLPKVAPPTKAKPLQMDDFEDDVEASATAKASKGRGSKRKATDVGDDADRRHNMPVRRLDFT